MADPIKLTPAQVRALVIFRYGRHWRYPKMRRVAPYASELPRTLGLREDLCDRLHKLGLMNRHHFGMFAINEAGIAWLEEHDEPKG